MIDLGSNPFRSRAAEQQRHVGAFVRSFGPGMLDLLPESLWDRPFVLRSAPGGGKTSLLRLMTVESLAWIHEHERDYEALAARLRAIGALTDRGPAVLGILLNLRHEYR